jgi:hypothetical protein
MTVAIPPCDAPQLDLLWWQGGSAKPADHAFLAYSFGPFPFASADASWSYFRDIETEARSADTLVARLSDDPVGIPFHGARDGVRDWPRELESKDSQHPIGSRSSEHPAGGSGLPAHGLGDEGNKDSSDDEDFEDLSFLHEVVTKYISRVSVRSVVTEGTGRTLMVHDLLNKFKVEPDLMNLFTTVGVMDDVDYVYLPLTYLKTGQNRKSNKKSSRNKGYGFVHFSREAAADRFAQLIQNVRLVGTGRGVKQMHTTLAKFQGVYANLVELLDLNNDEWRPKQGYLYIRRSPGFCDDSTSCGISEPLERVGITSLRKYILQLRD